MPSVFPGAIVYSRRSRKSTFFEQTIHEHTRNFVSFRVISWIVITGTGGVPPAVSA